MNLPNAITIARIAATPFIAVLVLSPGWALRLAAFALYVVAAISDYWDGRLARERNLVTDLGRLLDPFADKLLLFCTLLPMWWLTRGAPLFSALPADDGWGIGHTVGPVVVGVTPHLVFPFVTPVGLVGLPLWVALIVLGREFMMTVFRQYAARRGVIIAAIGPAKWKMGLQSVWVGAAFFWYFAASAATTFRLESPLWRGLAMVNGIVGTLTMAGAVGLTLYSFALYVRRYGYVFVERRAEVKR